MEIQYLLADPTKNITVLVTTPVSRALQPELASLLLDLEPEAEQVGFVETAADGQMRLQMMGGEFCGNATMSFGAWLCRRAPIGQTCRLALKISGAPALVECSITPLDGCFLGTVDMPLPEKIETLRLPLGSETAELSVVRLPGINHIIVPAQVLTRVRAEELIRRWAEVLHADALGILLLQEEELCFDPLVYVTQTDTAVWERGCGSGSAGHRRLSHEEARRAAVRFHPSAGRRHRRDDPLRGGRGALVADHQRHSPPRPQQKSRRNPLK